jgi:hypothetical protein
MHLAIRDPCLQRASRNYSRYLPSLVKSPITLALADSQSTNQLLMLHYDSLQVLGQSYISAVEAGLLDAPESMPRTPFDDWSENLGLPNIVAEGQPALEAYILLGTTPLDRPQRIRFDSVQLKGDEVHIDYPGGADWAAIYWFVGGVAAAGRPYLDFTAFSKLHLELKGNSGGEVVNVHVKDAEYPDDRAPISVDLLLSNEWQTYEIDLDEFAPNDFSKLHVMLGFGIVPAADPLAFSVRNARYH